MLNPGETSYSERNKNKGDRSGAGSDGQLEFRGTPHASWVTGVNTTGRLHFFTLCVLQ